MIVSRGRMRTASRIKNMSVSISRMIHAAERTFE
jgi:hypothetical protein